MSIYKNAKVLVTGGAGTVGREVVRQCLENGASEVVAFDFNENQLFDVDQNYRTESRFRAVLGDVRHESSIKLATKGIDYVIHSAALKHVPLSETSPLEAVKTNILGVQNVIDACNFNGVKKVVYTSTDKAVNPTNVMGTSKLMGEKLFTAAHANKTTQCCTIFSATRFGNVIGSSGSVLPLFCNQIQRGQSLTVTSEQMTRFVMTLSDAVRLVLHSLEISHGGELFITKMRSLRILDLAKATIKLVAPAFNKAPEKIEIQFVGPRPGEKMYEELMTEDEAQRAFEENNFFIRPPAFFSLYTNVNQEYLEKVKNSKGLHTYNSAKEIQMSENEITTLLKRKGVLPEHVYKLLLDKGLINEA